MKQTAVDWFFKALIENQDKTYKQIELILEQAKAMEKEQITQSFVGGADFKEMTKNVNKRATAYANQYYRNNYRSNII